VYNLKYRDAILHVKAVLINVANSNINNDAYLEFEAAGLKVIDELKAMDKPKKGAVECADTQD
jgi:hypothetical protein